MIWKTYSDNSSKLGGKKKQNKQTDQHDDIPCKIGKINRIYSKSFSTINKKCATGLRYENWIFTEGQKSIFDKNLENERVSKFEMILDSQIWKPNYLLKFICVFGQCEYVYS